MPFKFPEPPPAPNAPPPPPAPLDLWKAWKAAPTQASTSAMLTSLSPTIDKAASAAVGQDNVNPIVRGRARSLALAGLNTYDPSKGASLTSHLYNHLQGLKRYSARAAAGVYVPERVSLDRRAVGLAGQELTDRLGREPTEDELADHSGFSVARINKVRSNRPAANSGYFSNMGEGGQGLDPAVRSTQRTADNWERLVAQDFHPTDQKILEYHRQGLANDSIARKLRLSPAAISARKKKMQAVFDQEAALSPFA